MTIISEVYVIKNGDYEAGEWIELSNYNNIDDFINEAQEMIKTNDSNELASLEFLDTIGHSITNHFITQYSINGQLFDLLSKYDSDELETISAYLSARGLSKRENAIQLASNAIKYYLGEYDSPEAFINHILEQDSSKDYKTIALDLMCKQSIYMRHGQHYFINN